MAFSQSIWRHPHFSTRPFWSAEQTPRRCVTTARNIGALYRLVSRPVGAWIGAPVQLTRATSNDAQVAAAANTTTSRGGGFRALSSVRTGLRQARPRPGASSCEDPAPTAPCGEGESTRCSLPTTTSSSSVVVEPSRLCISSRALEFPRSIRVRSFPVLFCLSVNACLSRIVLPGTDRTALCCRTERLSQIEFHPHRKNAASSPWRARSTPKAHAASSGTLQPLCRC